MTDLFSQQVRKDLLENIVKGSIIGWFWRKDEPILENIAPPHAEKKSLELLDSLFVHLHNFNGTSYAAYILSGVYGTDSDKTGEYLQFFRNVAGFWPKIIYGLLSGRKVKRMDLFLSQGYEEMRKVFSEGLGLLMEGDRYIENFIPVSYALHDLEQKKSDKRYYSRIDIPRHRFDEMLKEDGLIMEVQSPEDEIEFTDLDGNPLPEFTRKMQKMFYGTRMTRDPERYSFYTFTPLPFDTRLHGNIEADGVYSLMEIPIFCMAVAGMSDCGEK